MSAGQRARSPIGVELPTPANEAGKLQQGRLSPLSLLPFSQPPPVIVIMATHNQDPKVRSLKRKIARIQQGMQDLEASLNTAITNQDKVGMTLNLECLNDKWRREEEEQEALIELLETFEEQAADNEAADLGNHLETNRTQRVMLRHSVKQALESITANDTTPVQPAGVPQPPLQVHPQPFQHYRQPVLKKFGGDVFEWSTWWESFEANVHQHPTMPVVAKFAELDRCLEGVAENAIAGLGRQAAHYDTAIQMLTQRFGDKDATIDRILGELLELPSVIESNNVSKLRTLLDGITIRVRMLTNLGKLQATYTDTVRPRLVAKLPPDFAIEWIEKGDRNTPDLTSFTQYLQKKVESREGYLRSLPQDQEERGSSKSYQGHRQVSNHKPRTHGTASLLVNRMRKSDPVGYATQECPFCGKDHKAVDCELSSSKRHAAVRSQNRCFNCLRVGHRHSDCKSKFRCRQCNQRHHTTLCRDEPTSDSKPNPKEDSATGDQAQEAKMIKQHQISCVSFQQPLGEVLLQTAVLNVEYGNRLTKKIMCLLDLGSQRTLIRRNLAEELRLKQTGYEFVAFVGLGEKETAPGWCKRRSVKMRGTFPGSSLVEIEALEHGSIASTSPAVWTQFVSELKERGLYLADERLIQGHGLEAVSSEEVQIDVLIGADVYWQIVGKEQLASNRGLTAVNSKFGWLLSGPVQQTHSGRSIRSSQMIIRSLQQPDNQSSEWIEDLDPKPSTGHQSEDLRESIAHLTAFFELEHIGIRDRDSSDAVPLYDRIKHFIRRTNGGRFEVPLPWNSNKERLVSNRTMAEARLRSLVGKLANDRPLLQEYNNQIAEFQDQGWISLIEHPKGPIDNYLPHLPVIRREKKSTKLRIVFDASAKFRQLSLNDCVEVGDNMYPDMLAIILRFGRNRIAWIGDVTKAFLQLELRPEDRHACRFLWINDIQKPNFANILTFQWNRVTFGLSCSPFLLAATIRKLLEEFQDKFPTTVKSIQENTFVDDWAEGAESAVEAFQKIGEAIKIFSTGKMEIGKWITNSESLDRMLIETGRTSKEATDGHITDLLMGEQSKFLGLRWNTTEDFYYFDPATILELEKRLSGELTKRKLIKMTAKLFDPAGFLAPVIVVAKTLFQSTWREKIGWDDPVSPETKKKWDVFIKGLPDIAEIRIPRWQYTEGHGKIVRRELQVFGDASITAYAAVAYNRISYQDGFISIRFICSKTRVTPLKELSPEPTETIPRLELLAALLAARLGDYLRNAIHLDGWEFTYWSDSTVVLAWMETNFEQLKPWVRNRVLEIRSLAPMKKWKHCPGSDNPADLASRGTSAQCLAKNTLWWQGPSWFDQSEEDWPVKKPSVPLSDEEQAAVAKEKRPIVSAVAMADRASPAIEWEKFGSYSLLLKVIAWCRRFVQHCRRGRPNRNTEDVEQEVNVGGVKIAVRRLSGSEISEAETAVVRAMQRESYPVEFRRLSKGEKLQNGSFLTELRPKFDPQLVLLRVTGRVDVSFNLLGTKPPILLPNNHPVLPLIVEHFHLRLNHIGHKTTNAYLKKKFWIIASGSTVKKLIGKCVICAREHARAFQEAAASLPEDRVRMSLPFEVTGVDFAGPLFVKSAEMPGKPRLNKKRMNVDGDRVTENEFSSSTDQEREALEVKVYFLVFTCAVTRAIRLELVEDMSASTFLNAFRRFFASTDGTVSVVYADNAKSFHWTCKYFIKLQQHKPFHDYLLDSHIDWKFSASRAPWWGGFWERMVRTTKELIRKTLFRSQLSWDQLLTTLKEIEMTINQRPLTYVSEGELVPLTPALLIGGFRKPMLPIKPHPIISPTTSSYNELTRMQKYRLELLEQWRVRWQREYLHDLAKFQTPSKNGRKVQLGDVVLIHDDGKRLYWRQGVVEKLHVGKGGLVRSVDVRTSKEVLNRPVQRLFPTEVRVPEEVAAFKKVANSTGTTCDEPAPNKERKKNLRRKKPAFQTEANAPSASAGECKKSGNEETGQVTKRGRNIRRPRRYFSDRE